VALLVPLALSPNGSIAGAPRQVTHKDFDPANFSAGAQVDNRLFPLVPGTRFVFDGVVDNDHGKPVPHRVIFTVTDLAKVIDGVRTIVTWDLDITEGQVAESELAFFAQDDDGNVWNLGEYPEEREGSKFLGAPSVWIGGVAGAKPGVRMRVHPRTGTSSYFEGLSPAIEFDDKARVVGTGLRNCVPVGCFSGVVLIDEWDPLDPEGGHQRKYYAPGVGGIRVGAIGGEHERLALTALRHLGPDGIAAVRREALKLEARAYRVSRVYRHTPPMEPLG
jgi:hypothetical protein